MNAIEIISVSKKYDDFMLDNINLTLPGGSIMGLVGENGAGKSTLIKLIMNAINADSGKIKVLGTDCTEKSFINTKEDIGIVLDEAYFPEVITADNVNKIMKFTYKNWNEKKFSEFMKTFRLDGKKAFKDYSRGMKMKLAIAVALSHSPKLLILDEATSGLDPIVRDEVLDIIIDFARDDEHSVLISSHIVSDLEKICDYISFIHNGRLIMSEDKDSLLEKYAIVKTSEDDFDALPKNAVIGVKKGKMFTEALVEKSLIPSTFVTEHTTLEDIILFIAKGDNRR